MRQSEYNQIEFRARDLREQFDNCQAFRILLEKLVMDYVEDTQQNVLLRYWEDMREKELFNKSAMLIDETSNRLQSSFDEEINRQIKHPFLIKDMIAKDEMHYKSYESKINEIIKDNEKWRNSSNSEADQKVLVMRKTLEFNNSLLDKERKLYENSNRQREPSNNNPENKNKDLSFELSKANKDNERLRSDLNLSRENEESLKKEVVMLSSQLKEQAAKYSELTQKHEDDLLK